MFGKTLIVKERSGNFGEETDPLFIFKNILSRLYLVNKNFY